MKRKTVNLISLVFLAILVGCGGGSDNYIDKNLSQETNQAISGKDDNTTKDINQNTISKDENLENNTTSQEIVKGVLIDSFISGVQYLCNDINSITTKNGEFYCLRGSKVSFKIGSLYLGDIYLKENEDKTIYITPAKLYRLKNSNVNDQRVLNFIRLIQSLDNDSNVSNGIDINSSIRKSLKYIDLNLSDRTVEEDDLIKVANLVNRNLISQNEALFHYIKTLSNVLKVTFENEPYYYQQWYLDKNQTFYDENGIDSNASIHSENLLKIYRGKGVKIAIIDDGLDITHEDLKDTIVKTYDISTHSSNVAPNTIYSFHGTATTGIIAARVNSKGVQGIASEAQIIFLKYKEGMSDSDIIELFNKAEEFGADIINCSWGTYNVSDAVKEKIVDLAKNGRDGKGTIIVFACGNDSRDMGNDESSIPEVISVGATDIDNLRAWYSNYGKNLDVLAPGGYEIGITTLDPMGDNGIAYLNENYILYNDVNTFVGTSASAPIVSGIVALMLEKKPNLTRDDIENILHNNSDKIGNIEYENGRNNYYGYGKVNLNKIMSFIKF